MYQDGSCTLVKGAIHPGDVCDRWESKTAEKSGVCTEDGPCDTHEFSESTTDNWVARAGGLPHYIRAVAHALVRSGHSERDAIATAVATMHHWAGGGGDVTEATRERARAALAEWEAKRSEGHSKSTRRIINTTYVDFPIEKAERQADGSLLVKGPCTNDDVDSDRQIVDPEFAARGLPKWLATGANVREMHQAKAIGLGVTLEREANTHWLTARIIEPTAVRLAEEKVLRAFSVGIANAKIDFTKNPKARGGTIVDGDFVEVSLVDRPANAACKVDIVKMASDGTAEFTDVITKADSDDHYEDMGDEDAQKHCGDVECQVCVVEKRKLSAHARDSLPDSDFALPGRRYPIHDENHARNALSRVSEYGTPEEKAKVRAAVHKRYPNIGDESDGKMEDADVEKGDATAEVEHEAGEEERSDEEHGDFDGDTSKMVPKSYVLQRLHDHLCPAYSAETVKDEYPACQDLHDAVDVSYWMKAVQTALSEDGGRGTHALALADLSQMYGMAVQIAHQEKAVLEDAHAVMHKAFQDMYPSVTVKPGAISPGMFKRPFIGSGRAQMHATGRPHMPMTAHVPDASNFQRPELTAGHERPSPSHGAPNTATMKGRQFYTNNARDQAAIAMETLHDYIVASHPGVCALKPMEVEAPGAPEHRVDNQATAAPTPRAGYTKAAEAHDADTETLETIVTKMVEAQTKKITKKLAKANKELADENLVLSEKVRELETQADPGAMAYRGGYIGQAVSKAVSEPEDPAEVERQERIAWLKGQVRHPDATVSRPALTKLQSLVTADELAEILTR